MLSVENVGPLEVDVFAFCNQLFTDSTGAAALSTARQFIANEVFRTIISSGGANPTDANVSDFFTQLQTDSTGIAPMGQTTRYRQMRNALRAAMSGGGLNPSDADVLSYFGSFASFNGNFASLFKTALQSAQSDLGLTYGATPRATSGNTSATVLTLGGTLSATLVPVPVLAKAKNTATVGSGALFDIFYDGGTTAAMTNVALTATPTALTGAALGLTLAASVASSVTNDTWQATCAGLLDQSGNGNHYTQATATSQPVIGVGINGSCSLIFDGLSEFLASGLVLAAPGTTPRTALAALRVLGYVLNRVVFAGGANVCPIYMTGVGAVSDYNGADVGLLTPPVGEWFTFELDYSNSASDVKRAGTNTTTGNSGNSSSTGYQIANNQSTFYGNIEFFALVQTPKVTDKSAFRAAVYAKYAGLVSTGLLPLGTPATPYVLSGKNAVPPSAFNNAYSWVLTGAIPNQYYATQGATGGLSYSYLDVLLPGTSTNLSVEAVSGSGAGFTDTVGVWTTADTTGMSGWSFNQTITFTGYNVKQTMAITLPAGTRRVNLVNNAAITAVSAPSYAIGPVAIKPTQLTVYGDSIAAGVNATPTFVGAFQQFRYSGKFASVAYLANSGDSLFLDTGSGTSPTTTAASIVASLKTGVSKTVHIEMGTNDWGLDLWNAASFGAMYGQVLDAVHALDSTIQFVCETMTHRSGETTPQSIHGSTLQDFRDAVTAAVSTRTSFCRVIDGTQAFTLTQIAAVGGLHPDTALHAQYYSWLLTQY